MNSGLLPIDYAVVAVYFTCAIGLGLFFSRRAGQGGAESFFVGSRRLPWWLAGTSMVATTFAADTPLAVTGIVAADGIAGNWLWWSWAIAHLTATFFFARLWRRSGVITDAEIVELRYSGRPAAVLRAFKAVYFGLFVNCLTMAWVIAAMVKISRAFFAVEPWTVILVCMTVSVIYTSLGGFRSVVVTDILQFILGMAGAVMLAWFVVAELGGLGSRPSPDGPGAGLLGTLANSLEGGSRSLNAVLDFVPPADHPTIPAVYLIVLLVAGWWRWAEGNGYIVQRLAACRSEGHAEGASLWFAVAHNALRPWPWILVALAAMIVYPDNTSRERGDLAAELETVPPATLRIGPSRIDLADKPALWAIGLPGGCGASLAGRPLEFEPDPNGGSRASLTGWPEGGTQPLVIDCPGMNAQEIGVVEVALGDREMAYPLLMRRSLPPAVLGLVVASLLAAFMSTIDTHINWGASYLVQDLYRRFIRPDAESRHYLAVSRWAILAMALLAGVSAMYVDNIVAVWRFLVTLGAGLGSVVAARWFWPRVTPHAEFAALAVTTVLAVGLEAAESVSELAIPAWGKIVIIALASLAVWVPTALFGPPNPEPTLRAFARKVRPPGPGWHRYLEAPAEPLTPSVWRFAAGLIVVFGSLFGTGAVLLGNRATGLAWIVVAAGLAVAIVARRIV